MLLVLALGTFPYAYYQLLRWVVAGTCFYTAWIFYEQKKTVWFSLFLVTGIVFNPIAPFYLSKSIWQTVDVVTIGIILCSFVINIKNNNGSN